MNHKSFTLIEILVVIVVIGILSAFILVGINSITQNANIAKSKAYSDSLDNALLTNKVSHWKLDGNANDSWGVNNGTLVGATHLPVAKTEPECVSGGCYQLDGTEDYIDFGNHASLSMGNRDHTVSIWVKFDNALAPHREMLFHCGEAPASGYHIYRVSGAAKLGFMFLLAGAGGGGTDFFSSAGSLVGNTWYNIVVTMDRDGSARAYINGLSQGSRNIALYQGDIQNGSSLKIGAQSSSLNQLDGILDEVRIYHEILSSELINQEYYSGINNLLANNQIDNNEFVQRLVELKDNLSQAND